VNQVECSVDSSSEILLFRRFLPVRRWLVCRKLWVTTARVCETMMARPVSFEGKVERREGEHEEVFPSSASLRRSKLLKYWCHDR
jgi:hypothetical protein